MIFSMEKVIIHGQMGKFMMDFSKQASSMDMDDIFLKVGITMKEPTNWINGKEMEFIDGKMDLSTMENSKLTKSIFIFI